MTVQIVEKFKSSTLTPAAAAAAAGGINSGVWRSMLPGAMPTLRLRMTGIGTVTMNSRNREVVVTGNVYTNTVSGAVIVDYAYPGDDATEFQIVLTGTATAEVI